MPSDIIYFFLYSACNVVAVLANELCLVEEKQNSSEGQNFPNWKMVYCNSQYQECCDKGCCLLNNSLQNLKMGGRMSPFVWFLIVLIAFGYVYFCTRYCYKKCYKKLTERNDGGFSRTNTHPQEVNLMLSFNQNRDGPERFNFESVNNAHIHVPFMPTTPITPPPAYASLTPPPTYNVAIHFPLIQAVPKLERQDEVDESKE